MKINWPAKPQRDDFLDQTLNVIGRTVDIYYVVSESGCSICGLDPVSNTSTDAFCPVCSGEYWIETLGVTSPSGHVTWKYSENLSWYSAGQQVTGDCLVRLNYTSDTVAALDKVRYFVVDNRVMQVDKVNLRGAPEVNRILVTLMEKEKES